MSISVAEKTVITRTRVTPVLLFVAFAIATVPFFLTPLPPVMDFPNHLTRIWLLAGGANQPPLSSFYEIRWWQASTNIVIDAIGVALTYVMSVMAVGKVLLLAMFLGPPLAAIRLNCTLFGRLSAWHLAAVALIWSATAVTGLISFQVGLAAALLAASLVHPLLDRLTPARLGWIGITAGILLIIHPFGALFFLVLISCLTLGERLSTSPQWLKERAWRIALLTGVCAVPVILLYLLSPHPPGSSSFHKEFMHWQPAAETLAPKNIILTWLSPLLSYRAALDLALALPVLGVVAWSGWQRRLRFHAGFLVVAGLMLLVSPFLPMNIGDGGAITIRFPIMAALMAFAGVRPDFSYRHRTVLAAVLLGTALLRIASIGTIWVDRAKDLEDLQMATTNLPAGSSVLILQKRWSETEPTPTGRLLAGFPGGRCAAERHFGSLLVMWRHVFIPTLFTVPGQQPLGVKAAWKAKSVPSSGIPFLDDMDTPVAHSFDPYLVNWRSKFDYVLLLNADFGKPVLDGTKLIASHGFAKLYKVDHQTALVLPGTGRPRHFTM